MGDEDLICELQANAFEHTIAGVPTSIATVYSELFPADALMNQGWTWFSPVQS
jgi:hypothetical protein